MRSPATYTQSSGPDDDGILRSAMLSYDRVYRYALHRRWADRGASGDGALWVMLNPSTADHLEDDQTIRRCIAFSRAAGFASMHVVNLFALRATDSSELRRHRDPIGPLNQEVLEESAKEAQTVIVAWGAHPFARQRSEEVTALLRRCIFYTTRLHCFGRTMAGFPRHPSRLAASTKLEVFGG